MPDAQMDHRRLNPAARAFLVPGTMALGGIFEMAGGADPSDPTSRRAATFFAVGLATSLVGFFYTYLIDLRFSGEAERSWTTSRTCWALAAASTLAALLGIRELFAHFTPLAANLFVAVLLAAAALVAARFRLKRHYPTRALGDKPDRPLRRPTAPDPSARTDEMR